MTDGIMFLLKAGFAFFFGVCILLWAFQPGHTWLYFVLIAFLGFIVVDWVTKSRQLAGLAFLLILLLFLFNSQSIDRGIQQAGSVLPKKAIAQGAKSANKYLQSKEPAADVRKAVQASNTLDQNQINQCLRGVVANQSANDHNLSQNEKTCLSMTGTAFQACMEKNVFNGSNAAADMQAAGCSGASTSAPASLAQKVGNLGWGVAVTAACDIAELANYFPWVNIDTSKCPE
jgi:hypothetical protein